MITAVQRIQAAGITLELSVCISAEALRLVSADSQDELELSRISIGSSTADQLAVLAAMQRTLVQGHEALRESLVQRACRILHGQIDERSSQVP